MKNPTQMDDLGVYTPILGNRHMVCSIKMFNDVFGKSGLHPLISMFDPPGVPKQERTPTKTLLATAKSASLKK